MNSTLRLVLILTSICAISSALLAAVYSKTREPIARALELRTAQAAAKVLPPDAGTIKPMSFDGASFFVASRDGRVTGVAVEGRSPNGYSGEIALMVGISPDGSLVDFEVIQASETPGLGSKIASDAFRHPLRGRSLDSSWKVRKDGGEIEAITAATVSSRAALESIQNAIAAYRAVAPKIEAHSATRLQAP